MRIEHALSGVKRSRSVKDTLRNTRLECSDQFIANASALHNLRVKHRKHPLRRSIAFLLISDNVYYRKEGGCFIP
ncbi:MAG: hypothetical protein ACRCYY_06695 [Trueperaceae bacterium]